MNRNEFVHTYVNLKFKKSDSDGMDSNGAAIPNEDWVHIVIQSSFIGSLSNIKRKCSLHWPLFVNFRSKKVK
jgi:hypothetical protein